MIEAYDMLKSVKHRIAFITEALHESHGDVNTEGMAYILGDIEGMIEKCLEAMKEKGV